MSGTKDKFMSLQEKQAVYIPDPYKNPPPGNINLLELAKYAERTGKDIGSMPLEELMLFRTDQ